MMLELSCEPKCVFVEFSYHLLNCHHSLFLTMFFLVSLVVIDKAGRRVLLVASGGVMFLSLSVIGAYFYVIDEIDSSMEMDLSWLPLAALITFMIGYSIGFATVPFILMGELLPARYRNLLGGIASRYFTFILVCYLYVTTSDKKQC